MKSAHGFTLVELLFVLSLAAIITVLAVPGLRAFISGQALKNASQSLHADLVFTRSEAIKRNGEVSLVPNGGNWKDGWLVTTADPAPTIDCETGTLEADVLRAGCATVGSGLQFQQAPAGGVSFAGNGRPENTASFVLCDANDSHARRVRVGIDSLPTVTRLDSCPP